MDYFDRQHCLVIAEAGVNHNGDIELAYRLCEAAKEAGADMVKFQTWKTENIITHNVMQAGYQIKNTKRVESQFDMLKRLELCYGEFEKIKKYCDEIGIQFISTADDDERLEFIVSLGVLCLKISSGDMGNIEYLRRVGKTNLPVIMSTGMSTLAEVGEAVDELIKAGSSQVTLLHCTTNYPCPVEEVNLRAMQTLKEAFKLPVGYSDHTLGMEVPVAAVAMGARVIEKHFTLDRTMEGPDHKASTEPQEFQKMIQAIRNIEIAMGNGKKLPTFAEGEISKVVLKRIVAKREIQKGKMIEENDICVKRNDKGLQARYWDLVVGSIARKHYFPDEEIIL